MQMVFESVKQFNWLLE